MRILVISADFPPTQSGEASHAYFTALHLARLGHDVHVLTSRVASSLPEAPFTTHAVMPAWNWRSLPRFRHAVRQCRPDAVILIFLGLMYHHHPMITFAPSIVHRMLPRARFVTQFENLGSYTWTMPPGTRLIRKLVARWLSPKELDYEYGSLLRDSDALVFLSQSQLAHLDGRHPHTRQKGHLIPPPPNVLVCPKSAQLRSETRSELGIGDDEFTLLYFGYIYPGKGIELILKAMAELLREGRRLRFLVIGGPLQRQRRSPESDASREYFAAMRALTSELNLHNQVHWLGPLPCTNDELSRYMFAADACVLPFQGGVRLNNSSFAACAVHGLPVITTRTDHTEPDFRDHENVLLCPPQSSTALKAAISKLMHEAATRSRLSAGVTALSKKWYSWDHAIEHVSTLLWQEKQCSCSLKNMSGASSLMTPEMRSGASD